MDYSTINIDALKRLKTYVLPGTYRLQDSPGNGCSGDAPGYPSYFTRSVYTQYGNTPGRGPQMVICYAGVNYVVEHHDDYKTCATSDDYTAKRAARLKRLWKPLPYQSLRVQNWIWETYRHFAHCYDDAERPEYGKPGTLIFPVPYYKLKPLLKQELTAAGVPKYAEAYLEAENLAVKAFNDAEIERAQRIAIPENHKAVRMIREFYPEHQPDLELIENPPKFVSGNWWETEAEQPSPDQCRPRSCGPHPINGNWCQWCGWRAQSERD